MLREKSSDKNKFQQISVWVYVGEQTYSSKIKIKIGKKIPPKKSVYI